MPGLKLNFKKDSNSSLYKFKELKLSNGCNTGDESGQLVVKDIVAGKNLSGAFLARRSLRSISSVAFTVDSSSKNFTLSTFCADTGR